MSITPYDTRFIQNLHAKISEDLQKTYQDLGSGTQIIRDNAAATGMACARYVGRIAGLQSALEYIKEINEDMSGKATKKKDQDNE